MSDEPTGENPDDLPPEAKKALEDFEALMKGVTDPTNNGFIVITEMFNGFRTAGMERIDACWLVAAYLMMHDHLGKEED